MRSNECDEPVAGFGGVIRAELICCREGLAQNVPVSAKAPTDVPREIPYIPGNQNYFMIPGGIAPNR
jgi:hypothetical protein